LLPASAARAPDRDGEGFTLTPLTPCALSATGSAREDRERRGSPLSAKTKHGGEPLGEAQDTGESNSGKGGKQDESEQSLSKSLFYGSSFAIGSPFYLPASDSELYSFASERFVNGR